MIQWKSIVILSCYTVLRKNTVKGCGSDDSDTFFGMYKFMQYVH